jgi:hypothetical protein
MRRILKFSFLLALLCAVRFAIGWPLERLLLHERLTSVIETNYDLFNWQFTTWNWFVHFFLDFMTWFLITLLYVKIEPVVHGHPIRKSLKVYGVMFLFFSTSSAVYMNQYSRTGEFFLYTILDRLLLFGILAVANGLIHPWVFRPAAQRHAGLHATAHPPFVAHLPPTPHSF